MIKDYPSVVLESGSWPSGIQLAHYGNLWLEGSRGAVRVVVLCQTFAPDPENKVKATLIMCRSMEDGTMRMTEWV